MIQGRADFCMKETPDMSENAKPQFNQWSAGEVVRRDSDSRQDSDSSPFESESLLVHQLKMQLIEMEEQNEALRRSLAEVSAQREKYFDLDDQATAAGSVQHLNESQSIAQIGSFHWNAQTNEVFWSDEAYRIFGQVPGKFQPTFDNYIAAIHPLDRPFVL
ncbi:MAG: hypothetical protein WBD31_30510, partial [Rubripirellula sp.]